MKRQVAAWKASRLSDAEAKLVIYQAFVEEKLDVSKNLAPLVRDLYFYPQADELVGVRMSFVFNMFFHLRESPDYMRLREVLKSS